MSQTKAQRTIKNEIYANLAVLGAVVMLVVAGLAYWAHDFIGGMVQSELAAQKVYFPEKGSPALDPKTYPDLQKYAGQLVDTPAEAQAYANGYIGRHLQQIANGKVYAEVSEEARKNPSDMALQGQKTALFQGETLRGILLTSGYGFGTVGRLAGLASIIFTTLAAGLIVVATLLRTRVK